MTEPHAPKPAAEPLRHGPSTRLSPADPIRVAVIVAAGQLGVAMLRRAPSGGGHGGGGGPRVIVTGLGRADLDITDAAAVASHPGLSGVDVVVNTAAWTDVDGAEAAGGEAAARAVNGVAPGLLARRCAEEGAHLVHVSTDYVFGGGAGFRGGAGSSASSSESQGGRRPLRPSDPTAPDTVYGRTKLAGEHAVLEVAEARGIGASIVRTAWVYSGPTQPEAADFVSTMLRLDERGRPDGTIDVVDDQHGNPTFVDDLADALWQLVLRPTSGTFHVTGSGQATWWELAAEVFATAAGQRGEDREGIAAARARVHPCTSEQFQRPAKRPAWSVLDGSAWTDAGFAPMPDWREALRRAMG